ncbi:MAG: single-stranded-DNA-specific exonuclease RecJ [Helicobacteraceae bacterium]|nr:single-stranded-DNA-specific exonuclease RecJ [Helicobacteraceae bacterium]
MNKPKLTLTSLNTLLKNRFDKGFKTLKDIPQPSLLLNADVAAIRIAKAIKNKERITLIGDYDVDGVTSTAIVKLFFEQIDYPLTAIIPNRFRDGYGVSAKILENVEADVVITVDNGISAIEAAKICKERGIDLIITDHHTPSEILPDAFTIVNPKQEKCSYPFSEICGAQVAWLVLAMLKKELDENIDMKQFLDLVALAVIADVMPLVDINRAIVISGLNIMFNSTRPSSIIIREFLDKSKISSEDIAFSIAPRLNSAGRLEDASIALDFLTAKDTQTAFKIFEQLGCLNIARKEIEAEVTQEAIEQVDKNDKVIVVFGEGWNEGVVGIVAARLTQKFSRPAIVLSVEAGIAKGSARSLGKVNIHKLITTQKEFLIKFGGHSMAAGLSIGIENIEEFKKQLNIEAQKISDSDFIPVNKSVGELEVGMINFDLLNLLDSYEPYGEANPRPAFNTTNADVITTKLFGSDKSHTRLNIRLHSVDHNCYDLLAFREVLSMPHDRKISCSFSVNKNEWNGRVSIQLLLDQLH